MAQKTGAGSKNVSGHGKWTVGATIASPDPLKVRSVRERRLNVKKINRLKAKVNRLRGGDYAIITDGRIALRARSSGEDDSKFRKGRPRVDARITWRSSIAGHVDVDDAAAPALGKEAFEPSARAKALLEGTRIRDQDLRAAGGAYTLRQVQALLHGVSRQAIDKRVRERSLLAVPGPSNRRSFPTLQFMDDGSIVDGLKDVLNGLPTKNAWTILNFLARPDDRLDGRKPIDVLKAGKTALAVEAARRVAQQGA